MTVRTLLLAAASLLPLAFADDETSKKDLEPLQGVWKGQKAKSNGQEFTADEAAKLELTVEKDGGYVLKANGEVKGTLAKLDASKKPAAIDLTRSSDNKTLLGIYEIDGDTLKMAVGKPDGKDRPATFDSAPDSGVVYVLFKREKK